DVFGVVVIELIAGNHLTDNRGDRFIIAEYRAFQLTAVDAALDHNLAVVLGGNTYRMLKLFSIVRLADTDAGAKIGRFGKAGISQACFDGIQDRFRRAFPLVASADERVNDR